MKVLLINGSAHPKGTTYTALSHVAGALEAEGITTDLRQIGHKIIRGCIGCYKCVETGLCIFNDDPVNEFKGLIRDADGLVIGSPVYFSGPNATLCAFMDRVFFSSSGNYACKPAAAVVCCRRGGASASFDRLNKYFTISSMPVVSSVYWNSIHGNNGEEAERDEEGVFVMEALGRNMAWMLKCIELAKGKVPWPKQTPKPRTNFIR